MALPILFGAEDGTLNSGFKSAFCSKIKIRNAFRFSQSITDFHGAEDGT